MHAKEFRRRNQRARRSRGLYVDRCSGDRMARPQRSVAPPPDWIREYLRELARGIVDRDAREEERDAISFEHVIGSVWPKDIGGQIGHEREAGGEIDYTFWCHRALNTRDRVRPARREVHR